MARRRSSTTAKKTKNRTAAERQKGLAERLVNRRNRTLYSEEFKNEVLDYAIDHPDQSDKEIAANFNMSSNTVSQWIRKGAIG